ncbi:MAG: transcriptional repressor [Candidatus Thermoplasmatota archaeon]|nr:transcriptional repressor [Candidatus Thermoplasmatota archaeon]
MVKRSRKTKQKELIQSEIATFTTLFTADDLYERLRKKDSTIGIATVYRFLKEIRKKKALHSYVCDRKMIYSKEKNNHCHFICQKCDTVAHFNIEKIDFLQSKIHGEICHFQIDVHGICEKCLLQENNQ